MSADSYNNPISPEPLHQFQAQERARYSPQQNLAPAPGPATPSPATSRPAPPSTPATQPHFTRQPNGGTSRPAQPVTTAAIPYQVPRLIPQARALEPLSARHINWDALSPAERAAKTFNLITQVHPTAERLDCSNLKFGDPSSKTFITSNNKKHLFYIAGELQPLGLVPKDSYNDYGGRMTNFSDPLLAETWSASRDLIRLISVIAQHRKIAVFQRLSDHRFSVLRNEVVNRVKNGRRDQVIRSNRAPPSESELRQYAASVCRNGYPITRDLREGVHNHENVAQAIASSRLMSARDLVEGMLAMFAYHVEIVDNAKKVDGHWVKRGWHIKLHLEAVLVVSDPIIQDPVVPDHMYAGLFDDREPSPEPSSSDLYTDPSPSSQSYIPSLDYGYNDLTSDGYGYPGAVEDSYTPVEAATIEDLWRLESDMTQFSPETGHVSQYEGKGKQPATTPGQETMVRGSDEVEGLKYPTRRAAPSAAPTTPTPQAKSNGGFAKDKGGKRKAEGQPAAVGNGEGSSAKKSR